MLHDYKGETPMNVITEEEHKKRPFYKKVSFWVLSALGLFFGGCSVYGLVLGYQYVQAVTQAAHIIADANESDGVVSGDSLKRDKYFLNTPSGGISTATFSFTIPDISSGYFNLLDGTNSGSIQTSIPLQVSLNVNSGYANLYYYGEKVYWGDYVPDLKVNGAQPSYYPSTSSVPFLVIHRNEVLTGTFYAQPSSYFRDQGYQEGYDEGHQEGYDEGYDEGSDAINLPQSVKVLLPEGTQYSVQYKTYIDGIVDRQGQMNSSQTGGAYATFDRSRTQKLRIDLSVPSGSRAFFLYTPSWTSAYPTDENYPLRQSWAVSGVTYLPTWVPKPQIYVDFTSADVPGLTYESVSVAFDVDHWGDIKVGVYSQGYNDGYQAGQDDPTAYGSGYDAGYSQGYDDGHTIGVAQGESQAVSGQKALVNMFVTAFQQPFDQIYRFLNFNVLGLNILALFTALLTLSIGIIIIKKVI